MIRAAVFILAALVLTGCESARWASDTAYLATSTPKDVISQELRSGPLNTRIELTPSPFTIGLSRTEVETRLAAAHYQKQPGRTFRLSEWDATSLANAETYRRNDNGLPCMMTYEVYVLFDDKDQLVRAAGSLQQVACL